MIVRWLPPLSGDATWRIRTETKRLLKRRSNDDAWSIRVTRYVMNDTTYTLLKLNCKMMLSKEFISSNTIVPSPMSREVRRFEYKSSLQFISQRCKKDELATIRFSRAAAVSSRVSIRTTAARGIF
jgi:hypothetical protein